ncbi:MAG: hypothetical protein ACRD68_03840 [Pyrinomonadaceae bacterium]
MITLLDVPASELPADRGSSPDPYADAAREILRRRAAPPFDPQVHIEELSRKLEAEP